MPLMQQWRKKTHLIEIIQLLQAGKNINIKKPQKTLETDAVTHFVLGTAEHASTLYLVYPTYNSGPPPALVTQPTEPSACLLCLLL